jgi:hypothetical protein
MKAILSLLLVFFLLTNISVSDEDVLRPKGKPEGYYGDVKEDYQFKGLPYALGFEVGGNYNMFSQDISRDIQLDDPILDYLSDANGLSAYVGVFGDFSFNEMFGLHVKLQYNMVSFDNKGTGLIDGTNINDGTTRLIPSEFEWDNNFSYFNIEPSLRINITPEFFALVGLTAQLPISNVTGDISQRSLEDGYFFQNGESEQSFEIDQDILNSRFGLNLTLGYKILMSDNISIVPQLHLHYFASKIIDDETDIPDNTQPFTNGVALTNYENKTLNHIRLSVALWFDL